jgi:hypothetical protein
MKNDTIHYSYYLGEHLDRTISYSEYIGNWINNTERARKIEKILKKLNKNELKS